MGQSREKSNQLKANINQGNSHEGSRGKVPHCNYPSEFHGVSPHPASDYPSLTRLGTLYINQSKTRQGEHIYLSLVLHTNVYQMQIFVKT